MENPSMHGMAQVILPQTPSVDKDQSAHADLTMQEHLKTALGRFVVCKFLVGTNSISTLSGILKYVGTNFFCLLDPCTNTEISCDIYSLKFISIYPDNIPDYQMYCNRRLYEQQYD